jgi:uncharacterized protein (DUF488 family)
MPSDGLALWTIGHSNTEVDEFVSNLREHRIDAVADVRSWPRSHHAPWFDRYALKDTLRTAGVHYVWLGAELGGRPEDPRLYTSDGRVRYDLVAATEQFNDGLRRLREGMESMRVAVMCSEESPEHCHRRLLVARVLRAAGVEILHIRRSGLSEVEPGFTTTIGLFGDEEQPWTSTASASRGRRPRVSSLD